MKLTKRTLALTLKPMSTHNCWQLQDLSERLHRTMNQEGGIGLAANQVGLRDRCFVMNIDGHKWTCINPEIIEMGNDLVEFNEGCLSFPGESCIITRPNTITVSYIEIDRTVKTEQLTGLAARCFQHELDHLNGITMWDRYKEQNAK